MPNAVILIALLTQRLREWPLYLIAVLAGKQLGSHQLHGEPWTLAEYSVGVCDFLEAAIAAGLLRHLFGGSFRYSRSPREILAFIGIAVVFAPLVATGLAAAAEWWLKGAGFASSWRIFFVGDSLGMLIVAPALISFWPGNRDAHGRSEAPLREGLLMAVTALALSVGIFASRPHGAVVAVLPYAVLPLFLWAPARFEMRGSSALLLLIGMVSVGLTAHGFGPFATVSPDINARVASLQLYLAVVGFSVAMTVVLLQQRARLEAERRTAQGLETLGRLAGSVAHDFNNDLTVVGGWAEILASEESDPSRREALDQISRSADRSASLTRQLLAFSRERPAEPVAVSLDVLIEGLRPLLEQSLTPSAELGLELAEGLPPALADPHQIEVVLINLALNARDAMPEGGRVRIATQRATDGEDEALLLSVSDEGEGIAPEDRERIFDPFFTTKPEGRGTGLGLATVRRIVEDNGGQLGFESELGRGTRFEIRWPIAVETPGTPTPEEALPLAGDETVLLVEPDPAVCELVRDVLMRNGYRVWTATDMRDARDLAASGGDDPPFDLLVADIAMAEKGAWPLDAEVRVLWTSPGGGGAVDDPEGALLRKPFGPAALLRAVRRSLDAA
jgi:signal transduction histidine kinase